MTGGQHESRSGSGSEGPARPRPLYGEYATPEEQRARIHRPDASLALEAGMSPEVPAGRFAEPTRQAVTGASAQKRAAGAGSTADRVVTIGLLAYGLINAVMSAIALADFPSVATTSMQMMGIPGQFTNVEQGRLFGAIAAVAIVVGWAVTAAFSWRRMRTGRITWWVPLVGAVVSYAVVYALLAPAILGDAAFIEYLRSSTP